MHRQRRRPGSGFRFALAAVVVAVLYLQTGTGGQTRDTGNTASNTAAAPSAAAAEGNTPARSPRSRDAAAENTPRRPRAIVENDPLLENQWHLKSRTVEPAAANVRPAWPSADGTGIVIGVVDDGLEHTHPDLQPNYAAPLSFDFNGNDPDPMPENGDSHGTQASGVAAARGGNTIGVAGVAPLAQLAGLRLIGAPATDAEQALALNHLNQQIHVSSNSWGPPDNGKNLGFLGPLTEAALETAATQGRAGRGRIFAWAAGNGRQSKDNCNYDAFANSRFVISVGAIGNGGVFAPYSEPCSAMLVTAPSQGGAGSPGLTTTTINGGYSSSFNGTSAATPVVAGIAALMLQKNPSLTWRDVQHILVRSSVKVQPADAGWTTGPFPHNENYGFGLVDAQAAVNMAGTWTNVAPELALPQVSRSVNIAIPDNNPAGLTDVITNWRRTVGFPHRACRGRVQCLAFLQRRPASYVDLPFGNTEPAGHAP
jgi:subtilisin family serine protease